MIVEIGRQELIALCISIQHTGPKSNKGFEHLFEKRPFVNGEHWRLSKSALEKATDHELIEIYSKHSTTFSLIK